MGDRYITYSTHGSGGHIFDLNLKTAQGGDRSLNLSIWIWVPYRLSYHASINPSIISVWNWPQH